MSAGAGLFMALTMGGVLALNVVCILLWLRSKQKPGTPEAPAAGPEPAPPTLPGEPRSEQTAPPDEPPE